MAQDHDTAQDDGAARLEAALERIARLRPAPGGDLSANAVDVAALSARLDSLIADLRAVLKKDFPD